MPDATRSDQATVRELVTVWIYNATLGNWPSIVSPTYGTSVEHYKPQVRTEFEAGYVQTRVRATLAKKRWTARWNYMPEADYQTLETFFDTNQGGSFNWTEPVTGASYVCRFASNSLNSTWVTRGATYYRSVEVILEEV
jgi:hypothetical protein